MQVIDVLHALTQPEQVLHLVVFVRTILLDAPAMSLKAPDRQELLTHLTPALLVLFAHWLRLLAADGLGLDSEVSDKVSTLTAVTVYVTNVPISDG